MNNSRLYGGTRELTYRVTFSRKTVRLRDKVSHAGGNPPLAFAGKAHSLHEYHPV